MKALKIALIFCIAFSLQGFGQKVQEDLYENGTLKRQVEVDGDFSKVKTYYENGQLKEIGSFFKGKADGLWVSFDESGNKISQGEFKNGEKHGDWLIWTPQGKALYHISYEKNVRTAATTVTE